jgi:hypothetical protein
MTEARMRVFPDQEQAIQWAKENKDKLRGVQLFTLQDGRGFAHFLPKDPSVLFQEVDPEEIDRRIRMIDERMGKIIPDAERARLGKMRQELVAQKAKQALAFGPTPGEPTGKTIRLWTPEGEREISDAQEDPTPNEAYLMRLFNFKSLEQLSRFLSEPDDLEALSHVEPPDEVYQDLQDAEEQSEQVENLERLYAMSQPPS